eukprot:sb/3464897/
MQVQCSIPLGGVSVGISRQATGSSTLFPFVTPSNLVLAIAIVELRLPYTFVCVFTASKTPTCLFSSAENVTVFQSETLVWAMFTLLLLSSSAAISTFSPYTKPCLFSFTVATTGFRFQKIMPYFFSPFFVTGSCFSGVLFRSRIGARVKGSFCFVARQSPLLCTLPFTLYSIFPWAPLNDPGRSHGSLKVWDIISRFNYLLTTTTGYPSLVWNKVTFCLCECLESRCIPCFEKLLTFTISTRHWNVRYYRNQTKLKTPSKAKRYLVPDQTKFKKPSKAKRYLVPDQTKFKKPSKAKRYLVPDQTKFKKPSKAKRYLVPDQTKFKKPSKAKRYLVPDQTKFKKPSKAKRYLVPDQRKLKTLPKGYRYLVPDQTQRQSVTLFQIKSNSRISQRQNLLNQTSSERLKRVYICGCLDMTSRTILNIEEESVSLM